MNNCKLRGVRGHESFAQATVRASPSRIVALLYLGRGELAVVETNINQHFAPKFIAKKAIELAKGGERDPERLCDQAVGQSSLPAAYIN